MSEVAQGQLSTGRLEVLLLLATRVAVLAFAVVGQSLLAYTLQPEGRGAYAICVLFGVLASVVCTPGTDRGAQYFVVARRTSLSQGVSVAFAICLVGSAAAASVALLLINSDLQFFQNADKSSFYLALSLIPLVSFSTATHRQIAGLRRFIHLAAFSLIRSVAIVLAITALVWKLELGVNGAIAALAIGHLAMTVFGVLDLRRNCGLAFEMPSRTALVWVLRYGLKEYVAKVGTAVEFRLGGLLLAFLASRGEIGLLSAGIGLITRVLIIPNSIATYLLPRVAGEDSGRSDLVAFCCRLTCWVTGALLLGWSAVSAPLVPFLLSDAFAPVIRLTWIMAIGVCATAGAEILIEYFRGTNRPQVASGAIWIGLSANASLLFALFPILGVEGAAWALTGGMLGRGIFLAAMFRRIARVPLNAMLMLRPDDLSYLWNAGQKLLSQLRNNAPSAL